MKEGIKEEGEWLNKRRAVGRRTTQRSRKKYLEAARMLEDIGERRVDKRKLNKRRGIERKGKKR